MHAAAPDRLPFIRIARVVLVAGAIAVLPAAAARADVPVLPVEIAQPVNLSQAAQAGVVHLSSKGGFGGDVVAVDVDGARIPQAPVSVTIHMEFSGVDAAGNPWPASKGAAIAAEIEQRLAGLKGSDGTPVTVDVVPSTRLPTDP